MPRRLDSNFVKEEFARYGYTLPDNFQHRNNETRYRCYDEVSNKYVYISVRQLHYRVDRRQRHEYLPPDPFEGMVVSDDESKPNTSFDSWNDAR